MPRAGSATNATAQAGSCKRARLVLLEKGNMAQRALIVDDDPSLRFVIREALAGAGWTTVEAEDGSQVVERIDAERFDLIVLDLYMPGMNGFEVLRRIRRGSQVLPRRKTARDVRIVVLSGAAGESGLDFARKIGADVCLEKPFEMEDLLAAARREARR
jgi:CheY-like chemotaxis protein